MKVVLAQACALIPGRPPLAHGQAPRVPRRREDRLRAHLQRKPISRDVPRGLLRALSQAGVAVRAGTRAPELDHSEVGGEEEGEEEEEEDDNKVRDRARKLCLGDFSAIPSFLLSTSGLTTVFDLCFHCRYFTDRLVFFMLIDLRIHECMAYLLPHSPRLTIKCRSRLLEARANKY